MTNLDENNVFIVTGGPFFIRPCYLHVGSRHRKRTGDSLGGDTLRGSSRGACIQIHTIINTLESLDNSNISCLHHNLKAGQILCFTVCRSSNQGVDCNIHAPLGGGVLDTRGGANSWFLAATGGGTTSSTGGAGW